MASYNVPLPGTFSFQRVVPLDLPGDDFTPAAASAGTPLTALGVVQLGAGGGISAVDADRLLSFYNQSVGAGHDRRCAWPAATAKMSSTRCWSR